MLHEVIIIYEDKDLVTIQLLRDFLEIAYGEIFNIYICKWIFEAEIIVRKWSFDAENKKVIFVDVDENYGRNIKPFMYEIMLRFPECQIIGMSGMPPAYVMKKLPESVCKVYRPFMIQDVAPYFDAIFLKEGGKHEDKHAGCAS